MPAVEVERLAKRYGDVVAVQEVSFTISEGSITGLLGPNGAGKSTTLRVLLGLAAPTAGRALIRGRPYRDMASPSREVGAVLESGDFDSGRSGRDHLRTLAVAAGVPDDRVREVLDVVGLTSSAGRRVGRYSLGMRQRLGLAAALLDRPRLLVLDEPMNGLDPAGTHWLRELLRGFAADGGTVLLSSHLLAEVAQTVDQVVIVDAGRVVAAGALLDLTADGRTLEEIYLSVTQRAAA